MSSLTPLAISVLALLEEQPMHPYEMYQLLMKRHLDQLVKVRPGSLYHTVERLARDQLVEVVGVERAGNRPERTHYRIRPAGRKALTTAVTQILRSPVNDYPLFPVGLGEAHNLPCGTVMTLMSERLGMLDEQLAEVGKLIQQAKDEEVPEAYWLTADYVQTILQAERDWIATLINRLDSKELPWPQPTP